MILLLSCISLPMCQGGWFFFFFRWVLGFCLFVYFDHVQALSDSSALWYLLAQVTSDWLPAKAHGHPVNQYYRLSAILTLFSKTSKSYQIHIKVYFNKDNIYGELAKWYVIHIFSHSLIYPTQIVLHICMLSI